MTNKNYIFAIHDPGGEYLMLDAGKPGWVLLTEEIGHNPNEHNGKDFRQWSDKGLGVLVRVNHAYGNSGTLPLPEFYGDFARRCANYVQASQGANIWIIGNESNLSGERPNGQTITPSMYADCYKQCRDAIHSLPGHEADQVLIGAVAPWNVDTGDWIQYFKNVLDALGPSNCDGITIHTYTHGHDPALIQSEVTMNPPYNERRYHFRAYRDFMQATPVNMRHLPVFISETDQNDAWVDTNNGWVKAAYSEINEWNSTPGNQQIRALCLYRWPNADKWGIVDKQGVIDDFKQALTSDYRWHETTVAVSHTFAVGDMVQALDLLNVRQKPGLGSTVATQLQQGDTARIIGGPRGVDGLTWYQIFHGWVAEALADGTKLLGKDSGAIRIRYPFDGNYPVTQGFGENLEDYAKFGLKGHTGTDFAVPWGTPILACAGGKVIEVGADPNGYGLYEKLQHSFGESLYAHLSKQLVSEGKTIQQGDCIGLSGATGNVHGVTSHEGLDTNNRDGSHLHFSVRVNPYNRNDGMGGFSDPEKYLSTQNQPVSANAFFDSLPDDQLLARLIYGEARGEPKDGWIAVAYCALNRAAKPGWWGKTLHDVILKPNQFSCFNAQYRDALIAPSESVWPECQRAAREVLAGVIDDPTGGAISYHRVDEPSDNDAKMIQTVVIGAHAFFKESSN